MSENETQVHAAIDIRGEVCPYTFIKSKLTIEGMESAQLLEILVNHLPAVENVPRSLENEGHEIVSVTQVNAADWKIIARKK